MANIVHKDNVLTVTEHVQANYLQSLARYKARKRLDESSLRSVAINGAVLPGDRTNNTPALRKNARIKQQLGRVANDNTYTYVTSRFHPDTKTALAVLTHYKLILASRRVVKHHAE